MNKKTQVNNSTFQKSWPNTTTKKAQVNNSTFQKSWPNTTTKKAQVTLFIIIAIVIVASILGALFLYGGKELNKPKGVSPEQFIKNCVRNAVGDKIQVLLDNGGRINPAQTINYHGKSYNYLCYQADYYTPCYNLYPALEKIIEEELKSATINDVQDCFNVIKEDNEDKGLSVTGKAESYTIDILPGTINLGLTYQLRISNGQTSSEFENFDTTIPSEFYDMIGLVREVVNAESNDCYFDYTRYMSLYPQYDITRISYDFSRIYSIKDRQSGTEFKFAVRSCAGKSGI